MKSLRLCLIRSDYSCLPYYEVMHNTSKLANLSDVQGSTKCLHDVENSILLLHFIQEPSSNPEMKTCEVSNRNMAFNESSMRNDFNQK